MANYIGIDIGGTSIKSGLIDGQGKVIRKVDRPTAVSKDAILADIQAMVQILQQNGPVAGIGVSMPGAVQANGFLATAGAIKAFYGINLRDELNVLTKLPVVVENDANAAAIAEQWLGAARNVPNYLGIVIGTGVGGALVINNEIYRGAHSHSGEFGWMIADEDDIEMVFGTLNFRGSTVFGLLRRYNQFSDQPTDDARQVYKRAADGELIARRVLRSFYHSLAKGIINLIAAFDPQLIVIGGAISVNQVFMKSLSKAILQIQSRHPGMKNVQLPEIVPAVLGNDAGMIGAVYQLIKEEKQTD